MKTTTSDEDLEKRQRCRIWKIPTQISKSDKKRRRLPRITLLNVDICAGDENPTAAHKQGNQVALALRGLFRMSLRPPGTGSVAARPRVRKRKVSKPPRRGAARCSKQKHAGEVLEIDRAWRVLAPTHESWRKFRFRRAAGFCAPGIKTESKSPS